MRPIAHRPHAGIGPRAVANRVAQAPNRVDRASIEASVENDVVTIEGRLNFAKYEGMQPVYTEYNVGHFARSFAISNKIDQTKISAQMNDGVVTIMLPKAEQAKPRKIQVS